MSLNSGRLLGANAGDAWWFLDTRMTIKADRALTAGAYTLLEFAAPHAFGPLATFTTRRTKPSSCSRERFGWNAETMPGTSRRAASCSFRVLYRTRSSSRRPTRCARSSSPALAGSSNLWRLSVGRWVRLGCPRRPNLISRGSPRRPSSSARPWSAPRSRSPEPSPGALSGRCDRSPGLPTRLGRVLRCAPCRRPSAQSRRSRCSRPSVPRCLTSAR
jgi:hypothetical protein